MKYRIYTEKKYLTKDELKFHLVDNDYKVFFLNRFNHNFSLFEIEARKNYTVERSIGIKDKNGQDIYENDVISIDGMDHCFDKNLFAIKYVDNLVRYEAIPIGYENKKCSYSLSKHDSLNYEVVGTIWKQEKELPVSIIKNEDREVYDFIK